MTKPIESEETALAAAKEKLDSMLAPLSKEEQNALLLLLLEATK